jgi:hypothetical protein
MVSIVMPSAQPRLPLPRCGPVGRHDKVSQAVCNNEPDRSQQTNQDFDIEAIKQPSLKPSG